MFDHDDDDDDDDVVHDDDGGAHVKSRGRRSKELGSGNEK